LSSRNYYKKLEILKGSGEYKEISRTTTFHEYILNAKSDVTIKENTLYFPGWNVLVNNHPQRFYYINKKYPGIIILSLPKGIYKVTVTFTNTPIQKFSRMISLLTLFGLIIISGNLIYQKLLKFQLNKTSST